MNFSIATITGSRVVTQDMRMIITILTMWTVYIQWCHWWTDDGGERSRKKKNTAPRWLEKQEKILGAKGGSWRSKKMVTTVYQSNISNFHKSLDLLISSIYILWFIGTWVKNSHYGKLELFHSSLCSSRIVKNEAVCSDSDYGNQ